MGRPAFKEAAAQERRIDAGEIIAQFRDEVSTKCAAIRRRFTTVRKNIGLRGEDRPLAIGLVKTVERLNRELAPFNNGVPPVDMKGEDDNGKFRSLTALIGRTGKESNFLDRASLDRLEEKLLDAVFGVQTKRIGKAAAVTIPSEEVVAEAPKVVPTERRPIPIPVEKPPEEVTPKKVEEKPPEKVAPPKVEEKPPERPSRVEEVPTAPPVAAKRTFKDELAVYEETLEDLKIIEEHHFATAERRKAKNRYNQLKRAIDRAKRWRTPTQTQKEGLARLNERMSPSEELVTAAEMQALEKSITRMMKAQPYEKAYLGELADILLGVSEEAGEPRQGGVIPALKSLGGDVAEVIAQKLQYDVWLLDPRARHRVTEMLVKASIGLGAGTTELRKEWLKKFGVTATDAELALIASAGASGVEQRVRKAGEIFEERQKLYKVLGNIAIDSRKASGELLDRVDPPTWTGLVAQQRRDRVRGRNKYARRSTDAQGRLTGKRSGAEDFKKYVIDKPIEEATEYMEENAGRLSYYDISSFLLAAQSQGASVSLLLHAWDYSKRPEVAERLNRDPETRKLFWKNFSIATLTLADPEFDPYKLYPKLAIRAIVKRHLGDEIGREPTEREINQAKRRILNMLRRSADYKYSDTLNQVYEPLSRAAPELADIEDTISKFARLQAATSILQMAYRPFYLLAETEEGELPKVKDRVDGARSILSRSIEFVTKTGISPDDPIVKKARERANMTDELSSETETLETKMEEAENRTDRETARQELVPVVRWCDATNSMAEGLLAIAKAEYLLSHPELCRSLDDATIREAKRLVEDARTIYMLGLHEEPGVDSAWHPTLPRRLANKAIRLLSPQALDITDAGANTAAIGYYDNPDAYMEVRERDAEGDPTPKAREDAATLAWQRQIRLALSLKGVPAFGLSVAEDAIRRAGWEGNFVVLDPRISGMLGVEKPIEQPVERRATLDTIDLHRTPKRLLHETPESQRFGALYVENYRLKMLKSNTDAPPILLDFNYDAFKGDTELVADMYAEAGHYKVANIVFQAYRDARIKQIDGRLEIRRTEGIPQEVLDICKARALKVAEEESVGHKAIISKDRESFEDENGIEYWKYKIDGYKEIQLEFDRKIIEEAGLEGVPLEMLAQLKNPQAKSLRMALGLFDMLKREDARLDGTMAQNQFTVRAMDPRDVDALAEVVAEGLSDEHINFELTPEDIESLKGAPVSISKAGPEREKPEFINYWFFFQIIGDGVYLAGPNGELIGKLVEGVDVINEEGKVIGEKVDVMVRTRREGPEGEEVLVPIIRKDGKVDAENAFFQVKKEQGKYEPTGSGEMFKLLQRHLGEVAQRRDGLEPAIVPKRGLTQPAVITHRK